MFDTRPSHEGGQPMLVVGIGHATEIALVEAGLPVYEADLHVLDVPTAAGTLALSQAMKF